jgi:hypothetical protein
VSVAIAAKVFIVRAREKERESEMERRKSRKLDHEIEEKLS